MHRGTLCVSQELPDPGRTSQVDDRISRVESVLEQVLRRLPDSTGIEYDLRQRQDAETVIQEATSDGTNGRQNSSIETTASTPKQINEVLEANVSSNIEYDQLSRNLLAAIPTQEDLDIISREPLETPSCLYGLPCVQALKNNRGHTSLRDVTKLPHAGTNPVLLAKVLLLLGSYLQSMSQSAMERLSLLSIDHQGIASHAMQTARRHVLSNDEIVRSIDGIECLSIESMYHNNAGRLRDAWITLRTAMSIAQMLGLDRVSFRPLVRPGPLQETREESIWFHLLSSDRYLSLMLGLPQGAPYSNDLATPEALAPCTPLQRLQRVHCLAGGAMIKHRDYPNDNTRFTEEFDLLLREAAANMEPQWWLVPHFPNPGEPGPSEDTLRLMVQFTHFHILARLHLPFLLRSPADGSFDHHKFMTINASREILIRYIALRGSKSTNNYCRGIDFLMFIASTTLCIAHINSSHFRRHAEQGSSFDYLGHQRPSDRGLMERAVQAVERSGRPVADEIDTKLATVLQHLLQSEARAAIGATFIISTSASNDISGCGGRRDDNKTLKIIIPYVGLIKIESDRVSASRSRASPGGDLGPPVSGLSANVEMEIESTSGRNQWNRSTTNGSTNGGFQNADSLSSGFGSPNWSLQGVDVALFNDLVREWGLDTLEL